MSLGVFVGAGLNDDTTDWFDYFLNGLIRQCEDALNRAERINALVESWKSVVSENPKSKLSGSGKPSSQLIRHAPRV